MPGRIAHQINFQLNTEELKNLSIPTMPLIPQIGKDIEHDFKGMHQLLSQIGDYILPELAQESQTQQKLAIAHFDSIITGTLHDSIEIEMKGQSADIGTDLFYASYVQQGRGPVTAKNKPFLVFKSPGYGWVRTKSVGPAQPRNYLAYSGIRVGMKIRSYMRTIMGAI